MTRIIDIALGGKEGALINGILCPNVSDIVHALSDTRPSDTLAIRRTGHHNTQWNIGISTIAAIAHVRGASITTT